MLSEELMIERSGKFTASENHKLMAGWDKPELKQPEFINDYPDLLNIKTKPTVKFLLDNYNVKLTGVQINELWNYLQSKKTPQGLITYAQEKAIEELFYHDPSLNFSTVHTRNGDEREIECIKRLSFDTDLNFVNTGDNQKHITKGEVGATPDGLVIVDNKIITGAEVKCKTPLNHAKSLLIKNNADMLQNEFEHYTQVQTQMYVCDSDHWYFANFNPFAKNELMKFNYIIVGRDNDFIKVLEKRIDLASKIKAEFLNKLKEDY